MDLTTGNESSKTLGKGNLENGQVPDGIPGESGETTEKSKQRQQDGKPGCGQVTDTASGKSRQRKQTGIQKDIYDVDEVGSEQVDVAFNSSEFLSEESHRDLVEEASKRIIDVPEFVRKNLKLVIKLEMSSPVPGERLKYIEIKAGKADNEIKCFYDNKEIRWRYIKQTTLCKMYDTVMNAEIRAKCVKRTLDAVTSITQLLTSSFIWSMGSQLVTKLGKKVGIVK